MREKNCTHFIGVLCYFKHFFIFKHIFVLSLKILKFNFVDGRKAVRLDMQLKLSILLACSTLFKLFKLES